MRTPAPLLLVLALLGCGGRVGDNANGQDTGSADAVVDVPVGEAGVRCGLDDGTPVCGWSGCRFSGTHTTDQACLIFKDPKADDQAAADEVGVCVKRDLCLGAKASLPGGVFCVDPTGKEL